MPFLGNGEACQADDWMDEMGIRVNSFRQVIGVALLMDQGRRIPAAEGWYQEETDRCGLLTLCKLLFRIGLPCVTGYHSFTVQTCPHHGVLRCLLDALSWAKYSRNISGASGISKRTRPSLLLKMDVQVLD